MHLYRGNDWLLLSSENGDGGHSSSAQKKKTGFEPGPGGIYDDEGRRPSLGGGGRGAKNEGSTRRTPLQNVL